MQSDLDADEAWERLRASRWSPPGRADTGARRKTYSAAIEQLEQMFRAAVVVGPATRPLQVFYGLSQAGRAIAAAAVTLAGQDWRLDSHGIKTTGFHLPFPDIEIRTDALGTQGSFVKVSEVLDSPVWEMDPVRLEDMWDLLPPNLSSPLTGRDRLPPLFADESQMGGSSNGTMNVPVCGIPDRVVDAGTHEALVEFLTSYPAVAQRESYATTDLLRPDAPPDYANCRHDNVEMRVNWLVPHAWATGTEHLELIRTIGRSYPGGRYFLPVLPGMSRELHPLMAWWSVLYALSMLARYEPAAWGKLISVDSSQHAVRIERLLECAIKHLPILIADTITEVST